MKTIFITLIFSAASLLLLAQTSEYLTNINITKVYPNPANQEANFDLEWNQQTTEAKIFIYNLLGTIVREAELSGNVTSVKIDTESLDEGIYFYSLVVRNRPTITQKLIIRH